MSRLLTASTLMLLLSFAAIAPALAEPADEIAASITAPAGPALGAPQEVEGFGLMVRLPQGWEIEEDGDGVRFTAPGGADMAGVALVPSAPFPAGGFDEIVASLAGDGVEIGGRREGTLIGLPAWFVELELTLDDDLVAHQEMVVVPLDESLSLTVIASANTDAWELHRPTLTAIMESLAPPAMAEADAFEAMEGGAPE